MTMFVFQYKFILVISIVCFLSACMGGGETGTGFSGTLLDESGQDAGEEGAKGKFSLVSKGVITGLDGVVVNGVTYDVDTSQIFINGNAATKDDLALGMVVTVYGDIDAENEQLGHAIKIEFDRELAGMVSESKINAQGVGTLTVMGQTVFVDVERCEFVSDVAGIEGLSELVAGHVIYVSGFADGKGGIIATLIELLPVEPDVGGEIYSLRGIVTSLDLLQLTFKLGGLEVRYTDLYLDLMGQPLAEGLYVFVTGLLEDELLIADQVIAINGEEIAVLENEGVRVIVQGIYDNETWINGEVFDIANDDAIRAEIGNDGVPEPGFGVGGQMPPIEPEPLDPELEEFLEFPQLIVFDGRVDMAGRIVGDAVIAPETINQFGG